jgi:sugar lactone lactonase YvrE
MWYGYTYPERGELKMYDPISLETFSYDHDAQDKNSFPLGSAISLEFDAKGNLWYMTTHQVRATLK